MERKVHRLIHSAIGGTIVLPSIFLTAIEPAKILAGFGVWMIFATAPDLDHKIPFLKHRGFSHTFWMAIAVGYIGYKIPNYLLQDPQFAYIIGSAAGFSYTLHLLEDMMTIGGGYSVKPFWPLNSDRYQLGIAKSDSIIFTIFSWILLTAFVIGATIFLDVIGVIEIIDPILRRISG